MLSNDIHKYIREISGASARHFANATSAEKSGNDELAARLKVESHVLLAVAVKLDQILSVNEPKNDLPPQLNKHDVSRSADIEELLAWMQQSCSLVDKMYEPKESNVAITMMKDIQKWCRKKLGQ